MKQVKKAYKDNYLKMEIRELKNKIPYLYYICSIENAFGIIDQGVFSRNESLKRNLIKNDFSNADVQELRAKKSVYLSNGLVVNLHDLVCLFFNPLNTTYYVAQRDSKPIKDKNLVVICFSIEEILNDPTLAFAFTNKNAAKEDVSWFNTLEEFDNIDFDTINGAYWPGPEWYGEKFLNWRDTVAAEFLVYPYIENRLIFSILCNTDEQKKRLMKKVELAKNDGLLNKSLKDNIYVSKELDLLN